LRDVPEKGFAPVPLLALGPMLIGRIFPRPGRARNRILVRAWPDVRRLLPQSLIPGRDRGLPLTTSGLNPKGDPAPPASPNLRAGKVVQGASHHQRSKAGQEFSSSAAERSWTAQAQRGR